jgi:hypothetical protein
MSLNNHLNKSVWSTRTGRITPIWNVTFILLGWTETIYFFFEKRGSFRNIFTVWRKWQYSEIKHDSVVKNTEELCWICQDFTTQANPSQLGKRFSHGGKMLHRVFPLRSHDFLFQDPLSRFFSSKQREERDERGERRRTIRDSILGNRTELYFRHLVTHVCHLDPTQSILRPERCHTVSLRAVVTSRDVKDSCHVQTQRVVVILRW